MNKLKDHIDTLVILGSILSAVLWMNGKFNDLEKDICIVKTVLIMKGIMPEALATDRTE